MRCLNTIRQWSKNHQQMPCDSPEIVRVGGETCIRLKWWRGSVHVDSLKRWFRDAGVKIFQIETTLNNDTFPAPWDFLQKREWEMNAKERMLLLGTKKISRQGSKKNGTIYLPKHSGPLRIDLHPSWRSRRSSQSDYCQRL